MITGKQCPSCGKTNDPQAKFCMECGTPLVSLDNNDDLFDHENAIIETSSETIDDNNSISREEENTINVSPPERISGSAHPPDNNTIVDSSSTESGISIIEESIAECSLNNDLPPDSNAHISLSDRLKKKKAIALITASSIVVIALIIYALIPKIDHITTSYNGDLSAGTVLDESNHGFNVKAVYKNGEKKTVQDWTIEHARKLSPDESSRVTINYKGFRKSLTIRCTDSAMTGIEATYTGKKEKGVTPTEYDFTVEANYKNGTTKAVIDGFTISPSDAVLKAGVPTTITVSYEGFDDTVTIKPASYNIDEFIQMLTESTAPTSNSDDNYVKYEKSTYEGSDVLLLTYTPSQGTITEVSRAVNGNAAYISKWNELVNTIQEMSESLYNLMDSAGLTEDWHLEVKMVNELNPEKFVLMLMDNHIIYDIVRDS